ncbi:MAG: glyoxylate reductase [Frankiales bacterium]|nr:glyoxylate reductase [Frankiales bacterium]
MARILVTSPMLDEGLGPVAGHELVAWDRQEPMATAIVGCDAILCLLTDQVTKDVVESGAPGLRIVANAAVGYDNIDVAAAASHGVVVTNTPGLLDETTADTAFALILAACRRTTDAEAALRAGRWTGWELEGFLGVDVHGAELGLVGYGRIARAVARRARGFGMRVRHHARRPTGEEGYVASLDELLATADVVSLHVPLTPETHHLIDAKRLALMKPTAVLINTARGPVLDEIALAAALESDQIFAAGLDVYDGEPTVQPRLLTAPHLTLLPHIGSATRATRVAMVRLAAQNIAAVLTGEQPLTPVNVSS